MVINDNTDAVLNPWRVWWCFRCVGLHWCGTGCRCVVMSTDGGVVQGEDGEIYSGCRAGLKLVTVKCHQCCPDVMVVPM
jgi:hypothetical protein